MQFKEDREWIKKVSQVFSFNPRDASNPDIKLWIPRPEEKEIKELLYIPSYHICIDGPSGTGKTSLALTMLGYLNIRYVAIQLDNHTTWPDFCKLLVRKPDHKTSSSFSISAEGGVETGLPLGKLQVSLLRNREEISAEEIAQSWSENDLCRELFKEKVALFIDDFEKASNDLCVRIADTAKKLTQSYSDMNCKLIIVGTDNIYRKLTNADHSLSGRIKEISLGGFGDSNTSWTYLVKGWNELGIKNPTNTKFNPSKISVANCMDYVILAADGLPKSLTELGFLLTKGERESKSITEDDIVTISKSFIKKRVTQYLRDIPELKTLLNSDPCVRSIFRYLINQGASRIYNWNDILNACRDGSHDDYEYICALEKLVNNHTLTQTGQDNEVIYFSNMDKAHTLYVALMEANKIGVGDIVPINQLELF